MSTTLNENERFNAEAAAWDSNPTVHRASSLAYQSILEHFSQLRTHQTDSTTGVDVLEIGCGTGLLSFMIAPRVRSLTAVDAAHGIIDAFNLKLAKNNEVKNVLPVCAMLTDPDDARISSDPLSKESGKSSSPRRFDLIISHLVLHHLPSIFDMLVTMHGCLKQGGSVALTDFEDFGPEAKKFHPEGKLGGVHRHGVSREGMKKMLKDAGFVDVIVDTAFEIEKGVEASPGHGVIEGEGGTKMNFPFLICIGKKA